MKIGAHRSLSLFKKKILDTWDLVDMGRGPARVEFGFGLVWLQGISLQTNSFEKKQLRRTHGTETN
jgi:hypothetical protein